MKAAPSINGTVEEVAAFFRVSIRIVYGWKKLGLIGHWQEGHNIVFGECHVIDWWIKYEDAAKGLKPGEAEERARILWRQHLGFSRAQDLLPRLEENARQLMAIMDLLKGLDPAQQSGKHGSLERIAA